MRRFRDNFSFFIFRFSLLAIAAVMTGCGVSIKYSLSGASIPPDAKTFSVAYFPNNATMVSPILSSTLTEALVDMFTRRTRLMQVDEGGDFAFEGEIVELYLDDGFGFERRLRPAQPPDDHRQGALHQRPRREDVVQPHLHRPTRTTTRRSCSRRSRRTLIPADRR